MVLLNNIHSHTKIHDEINQHSYKGGQIKLLQQRERVNV